MVNTPTKLAVLISGSGSTLQNLIQQIAAGELECAISVVVASRSDIKGCERAREAGLRLVVCERKLFCTAEEFNQAVFDAVEQAGVDLVCLCGWLCKLHIAERWEGRVVNIHPSLLPRFGGKGMYGLHVHQAVIDAGETESGCTVHLVNNEYDSGPIVLQRSCAVRPGDTAETLAGRVFEQEKLAYPAALKLMRERIKQSRR